MEENKEVVETQPTNEEVKTFTQEELNKIVKDRLAKEKKKYPDKAELESFNVWKESQKTEQEKINEKINSYEQELQEHKNNYAKLQFENLSLKKGINNDSINDVYLLAKSYTGEDVSLEDAIDKVLEKYPNFKASTQTEENQRIKIGKKLEENKDVKTESDYMKAFKKIKERGYL